MRIGGLQKFSLVDYPGKISAVVFTQGCNFRCPYCHNPQLVDPALFESALDESAVVSFLKGRAGRLGGIVVSGGEPLLQDDLPRFLDRLKSLGFPVKLDTNGSLPDRLAPVIQEGLVDFVAMDIKAPFHKYSQVSGVAVDVAAITGSIRILREARIGHMFRTTVASPIVVEDDVRHIRQLLTGASPYIQQPLNNRSTLPDRPANACADGIRLKSIP